jgi:hypothetical protein
MRRRRHFTAPPPPPPPGFMWWFWKLVPIEVVEQQAQFTMGNHDERSRAQRDRANGDTLTGPARHYHSPRTAAPAAPGGKTSHDRPPPIPAPAPQDARAPARAPVPLSAARDDYGRSSASFFGTHATPDRRRSSSPLPAPPHTAKPIDRTALFARSHGHPIAAPPQSGSLRPSVARNDDVTTTPSSSEFATAVPMTRPRSWSRSNATSEIATSSAAKPAPHEGARAMKRSEILTRLHKGERLCVTHGYNRVGAPFVAYRLEPSGRSVSERQATTLIHRGLLTASGDGLWRATPQSWELPDGSGSDR